MCFLACSVTSHQRDFVLPHVIDPGTKIAHLEDWLLPRVELGMNKFSHITDGAPSHASKHTHAGSVELSSSVSTTQLE